MVTVQQIVAPPTATPTVSYITTVYLGLGGTVAVTGGGGEWGGGQTMGVLRGTGIGQFFFCIRKQHSVDKVHTLRYSVSKIS